MRPTEYQASNTKAQEARERNRTILAEWSADTLKFLDEMREEFEGCKVISIWCDVAPNS